MGKKVVEIKYYFLPEIWPKSISVLYPIWVAKGILININYNTSLKLKKHLNKLGMISFKTFRSNFFPYLLEKPMSISEHEHIHIQRKKLTWYLRIIVSLTAGKASFFSRSFIYFHFLLIHRVKMKEFWICSFLNEGLWYCCHRYPAIPSRQS